ncbi:MAG: SH3 domain-containing protein [Anaerolineales bacterium]|nr:SH3 domain-containing protein [Anaerolineales bacterium]
MKSQKSSVAFVFLIIVMLACNLPGSGDSPADLPSATVEAPVTIIVIENSPTPAGTDTPSPSATPELPAEIRLTKNSNCRLGPSSNYIIVDQIASGNVFSVVGRNDDNTWWQIVNTTNRECWIFYENAEPNSDLGRLPIKYGPALPGIPGQFYVTDQQCQPGPKKFAVTLSWTAGPDTEGFRLYRDGKQIIELKASKFNYKDINAPYGKNITYELEAYNKNGTSEKVIQIVPACK